MSADPAHLAQHGLSLHTDALHAVHDDQGSVSDAQSCSDLAGEVNVPGRVDEVDEVVIAITLLGEALELLILNLVVQRDACRADIAVGATRCLHLAINTADSFLSPDLYLHQWALRTYWRPAQAQRAQHACS